MGWNHNIFSSNRYHYALQGGEKITIIGIEGGIGTGKTLTGVHVTLQDLEDGKRIYSNVRFKNITPEQRRRITYLNAETINNIFEKVKKKELDLTNSTIFLQEMHNYMDSRNSGTAKNKVLSYWILQSRHTGKGSCDIIYDTQELRQVDLRLRNNTDHIWHPVITVQTHDKIPCEIVVQGFTKLRHNWIIYNKWLDVRKTIKQYDTHQIVEF